MGCTVPDPWREQNSLTGKVGLGSAGFERVLCIHSKSASSTGRRKKGQDNTEKDGTGYHSIIERANYHTITSWVGINHCDGKDKDGTGCYGSWRHTNTDYACSAHSFFRRPANIQLVAFA
jgi:hypothetical protein